jgi:hypothetical protein
MRINRAQQKQKKPIATVLQICDADNSTPQIPYKESETGKDIRSERSNTRFLGITNMIEPKDILNAP